MKLDRLGKGMVGKGSEESDGGQFGTDAFNLVIEKLKE